MRAEARKAGRRSGEDFPGLLRKLIDCGQHKMFFVAPIVSVLPHSIGD